MVFMVMVMASYLRLYQHVGPKICAAAMEDSVCELMVGCDDGSEE